MAEGATTRVVLMTAPDREVAERIVRTLVEERLVACGNLVPGITSIYRWQGAIECDAEVLAILKTSADRVSTLLARASELHPYEVPELLVLPVEGGYLPYLEWVRESTSSQSNEG